jgi:MFS family permease
VLLLAVVCVYTTQQTLFPVLPPLTRVLGLTEVQLGLVQTSASLAFSVSSLGWGRLVDRWGTRRTLLTGMTLVLAGLVGLAGVSALALDGPPEPGRSMLLLMVTRGLLFGLGLGAVPVAALTHISRATSGEAARVRAVGRLGAAQGLAIALGPAVAGLLAFAGLLGPVWGTPILVGVALVVVWVVLPPEPAVDHTVDWERPRSRTAPVAALRPWDRRIRPFLATGFLVFFGSGMTLTVLGFAFQDRLRLGPEQTVQHAGVGALAAGMALIAGQALVVRRLGWPPRTLLRVGTPIALVGFLGFAAAGQFPTMVAANATIGLGMALAVPGYTAGATLRVHRHEQGMVAGLISATTGATFVVTPVVSTVLYRLDPTLPMLVSAGCVTLALTVAMLHPGLRVPR